MTKVRVRGEEVRRYILASVEAHPANIAKVTSEHFKITRQAVNKHLQKLVEERSLLPQGNTKSRSYKLAPLVHWQKTYEITHDLAEDRVWREAVFPSFGKTPQNVLNIWEYGFTEMFNNALDHSEGTQVSVDFQKTAAKTQIAIYDNGVGIFKKIQTALNLLDERHAVLELAKGKLTTDPKRHTGEGIFFASRMFDDFEILSGGIYFTHKFEDNRDWILERDKFDSGTSVWMQLSNHTARTTKKVFDKFTSGESYGFTKTVVPVRLAKYGDENLVSRSQAKRLLARIDRFETVILDFSGVELIGQAFADEIFRVFAREHPRVQLVETNASKVVEQMIRRARGNEQR